MMTALRSGLEFATALIQRASAWRLVVTRRTNICDEIELDSVDLSRKDDQRVMRNLMRGMPSDYSESDSDFQRDRSNSATS